MRLWGFYVLQTYQTVFFSPLGVDLEQTNQDLIHFQCDDFYSQFKSKVGNILTKDTPLRFNLNIDDDPIVSRSHTHPGTHRDTLKPLVFYPLPSPHGVSPSPSRPGVCEGFRSSSFSV